jgi:hypothetical protein
MSFDTRIVSQSPPDRGFGPIAASLPDDAAGAVTNETVRTPGSGSACRDIGVTRTAGSPYIKQRVSRAKAGN